MTIRLQSQGRRGERPLARTGHPRSIGCRGERPLARTRVPPLAPTAYPI